MNTPKLLGRFNYLQYKKGYYCLVFVPYIGNAVSIVAKYLDFETVRNLMDDLNGILDDSRQIFLPNESEEQDVD